MKTIRSFLKKFGPLVLITGLLLSAFAVKAALANYEPTSSLQARQQMVVTALRVERANLSSAALKSAASDSASSSALSLAPLSTEIQPGDDKGVEATEVEPGDDKGMEATEVENGDDKGMQATATEVEPGDDNGVDATPTEVEPGDDNGKDATATPVVSPTLQATPTLGDDNPEDNDNEGQEVENQARVRFEGTLSAIDGNVWTIDGMAVMVSASTEIKGNPQVGDTVRVEGVRLADGSLQINRIQFRENNEDKRHEDRTVTATAVPPSSTQQSTPTAGDNHGGDNGSSHGGDNGGSNSGSGDGGHGGGGDDGGGHH